MGEATTSFARDVKEEITRIEIDDEAKKSLLSAFCRINGLIHISGGKESLLLSTESAQIAKTLYSYVVSLYGPRARFAYTKGINFRKRVKYHVLIDDPDSVLNDLEVDYFSPKIPKECVKSEALAASYLAGAFLSSGSVNDPKSANYHLEFALSDEQYARWLMHLLNKAQGSHFSSKMVKRRKQWVVYLKKGEQIADLLIMFGANENCLRFENARVDRDFANQTNRLANLDAANFAKSLKAGERQKKEAIYFRDVVGLDNISSYKLQALIPLRIENEDATLEELAESLSEMFATTITKSNVNHLFRAMHEEYMKRHGE